MRFPSSMIRSTEIVLVALFLLVLAPFTVAGSSQETEDPPEEIEATSDCETAVDEDRPVKEIKLYVEQWKWTPKTIRVEQGTLVKIEALSYDASRRFVLKPYRLKVQLPQDEPVSFEFVAEKKGKFRWRCGRPCGNGCAKLTGTLIVE